MSMDVLARSLRYKAAKVECVFQVPTHNNLATAKLVKSTYPGHSISEKHISWTLNLSNVRYVSEVELFMLLIIFLS